MTVRFCLLLFGDSPGVGGVKWLAPHVISLAREAFARSRPWLIGRAFWRLVWRNFHTHNPDFATIATAR